MTIQDFALSNNIEHLSTLTVYRGKQVYHIPMPDDQALGVPSYIIEDGDSFKFLSSDETFEIMRYMSENDLESEDMLVYMESPVIKSIKITSNGICYGPMPDDNEEVEQYLTISSNGRVWFSARNYKQYTEEKGYCRKKQLSIGKWKAEFILRLICNLAESDLFVTDVGSFDMEIRCTDGTKSHISGSLIGGVTAYSYGRMFEIDLTRLIRRYIPVYGLWVFDGSTSPDYEGKKAIYKFAESWEKDFVNDKPNMDLEFGFTNDCTKLGFQMDSEEYIRLSQKAGSLYPYDEDIEKATKSMDDIDVLGAAVFAYCRGLTHWGPYQVGDKEKNVFLCFLRRLKELTRKKKV